MSENKKYKFGTQATLFGQKNDVYDMQLLTKEKKYDIINAVK